MSGRAYAVHVESLRTYTFTAHERDEDKARASTRQAFGGETIGLEGYAYFIILYNFCIKTPYYQEFFVPLHWLYRTAYPDERESLCRARRQPTDLDVHGLWA